MNEDLLEYFMTETNKRLDDIDKKMDELLALRAQIFLLAGVVSVVVAGGIQLVVKFS